jgi:hypothetical protein
LLLEKFGGLKEAIQYNMNNMRHALTWKIVIPFSMEGASRNSQLGHFFI